MYVWVYVGAQKGRRKNDVTWHGVKRSPTVIIIRKKKKPLKIGKSLFSEFSSIEKYSFTR